MKQYVADREIGLKELGEIPNKESSKYKSFIKKYYGQWVKVKVAFYKDVYYIYFRYTVNKEVTVNCPII